ncbi:MAG: hypothetical protein LUH10_09600 [Tannerellaceae bacterium]|nr:hypothetical protein [Tannerellaceae bacterium]
MQQQQPRKRGPKSINYQKRGIKIKEEIDALVQAILTEKKNIPQSTGTRKIKFSDLDLENEDLSSLIEMQHKLSRVILERTKNK